MNETSSGWQTNIYGILPHPAEPCILLLPGETGWALPHVHLNEAVWEAEGPEHSDLGRVTRAMRKELAVDVTVLRVVRFCVDEDKHQVAGTVVLENHNPTWKLPSVGQWVGRATLAGMTLAQPQQRSVVADYLAEVERGIIPEHRVPWARPGWFAQAESWIHVELERLGYTRAGPIEQFKSWCLSCILRAPTATGDVYFKVAADLPLFVNEAVVMQGLAERYPRHVPAPLRIDRERGWMLLPDFGRELGWAAPIERREEALRAFGQLQIDSAKHIDELLTIGCLDRRLDRLVDQIDPLINSLDEACGLTETEIAQLRERAPRLKTMCAQLASYRVPSTLAHGDMHMSNVALCDGDYQFFDWTDACVTHPFLDMIDILHENDGVVQARLRDAYLSLWTDFEPMDRLLEMWALAYPLCALHQAVSYQHILANVEDAARRDFGSAIPFWVGKILKQQHLSSSGQGEHGGR